MTEFLSMIQPNDMIPIFAIAGVFLTMVTLVLALAWRSARRTGIAAKLKQDMLDRGMSAEEIRIVLEAGG